MDMEGPRQELREWVEENGGDLDVGDHPTVLEDGDWSLHLEDEGCRISLTHYTEEDGATVLYGSALDKSDGREFDLMLQEEPMIQGIPELGEGLRFRPYPDAPEIAIGRDSEGILRMKILG